MSSYITFAQFYDCLTENVDYKVRSDYISNFFSRYGNGGSKVLDLACGTGNIAVNLNEKGYDVTGIDLSEEMLCVASAKSDKLTLIKADMTDFETDEKFDYCVCSLDSINHLDALNDVKRCFECVSRALNDGGLFVFDVNTVYKHKNILADNSFVFDYDDFFLAWDNEYLGDNKVRIMLDFFVFNGKNYDRYSEEFCEKAYEIDELTGCLDSFDVIGVFNDMSPDEYKDDSERIYFVCRRK